MDKTTAELLGLLREDLHEMKITAKETNQKVSELHVQILSTTVTKSACAECKKDNADSHKSFIGWIIGMYSFLITIVIVLFTKK